MMMPTTADAATPLAGLRVLDLSRLLPGPYCSLLLAQLGAEVIKVETPLAGDYARMAPPELGFGGVFEALNRGKRSVAIDYRKPAGRDLVLRLAASADVFLESSRPGRLERCGLGAVTLRALEPSLVYCSISGYGQAGPRRDAPGHDIDYLAVSGVLSLLGAAGAPPMPAGVQLADIAAGTFAAARILAALVRRALTGHGCYLDVAAIDGPVSWLGTLGDAVDRSPSEAGPMRGAYPCYATYRAADGRWLAVGALEVPFWRAFCAGLGREDLASRQFDPAAIADVGAEVAGRSSREWLDRFSPEACVALVRTPAEALADTYVATRGFGRRPETPAPRLGADTAVVLAEAGVPAPEIGRLAARGVLAGAQSDARAERAARLGAMLARRSQPEAARTA